MKVINTLIVLSLAALVKSQGEKSMILAIDNYLEHIGYQFRDECIKESNVDVQVLDNLEKKAILTDDQNLKCYLKCSYTKSQILDHNGIIDIEKVKEAAKITNQELLTKLEQNCKHPKSTDLCQVAFDGITCGFTLLEKYHIF